MKTLRESYNRVHPDEWEDVRNRPSMISVFLCDAQPILHEGLKAILSRSDDYTLAGGGGTLEEASIGIEEVEPGLWEEEITWERFAYGQGGPPPQEVMLEEAPAVIGLSYRRQPGKLGVPVADLAGVVPGVAGMMLQTLALDVATWRQVGLG